MSAPHATAARCSRRRHVAQRARERYGLTLDDAGHEAILDIIRAGDTLGSWPARGGCTVHVLDVDGRPVRVLYDDEHDELVTFLPPTGEAS